MILIDLGLLVFVSALLTFKSLYLGSVTLVIGFLIAFQIRRTQRLLGSQPVSVSMAKKIKAALFSVMIAFTLSPLFLDRTNVSDQFERMSSHEVLIPIMVVLGLFTAAMMSALAIEKRKR